MNSRHFRTHKRVITDLQPLQSGQILQIAQAAGIQLTQAHVLHELVQGVHAQDPDPAQLVPAHMQRQIYGS